MNYTLEMDYNSNQNEGKVESERTFDENRTTKRTNGEMVLQFKEFHLGEKASGFSIEVSFDL
ncbi:hypothetical protein GCM10007049_08360 [Echinicola pacifica]|uniref:Uncharacterized protein n=1 Tax=Echinicola pacifica TaxID=346377 RepID=A0A918PPI1_9BACT|nr:hypothetical protein GCM10007049_08360 [Echinicola pacifica]